MEIKLANRMNYPSSQKLLKEYINEIFNNYSPINTNVIFEVKYRLQNLFYSYGLENFKYDIIYKNGIFKIIPKDNIDNYILMGILSENIRVKKLKKILDDNY